MNLQEAEAVIQLAYGDYQPIRDAYRSTIYTAVLEYLGSTGPVTSYRNQARRAVQETFYAAAEQGLKDGGGDPPLRGEDLQWMNMRTEAERANIDKMFQQLRELRNDPEPLTSDEKFLAASTRAENYTASLDSIYNEAKVRGAGAMMLTFDGQDGHAPEFPCPECKKLKGQRHRASWWVSRGLVPYPGNSNFTCGTWQCRHFLYNDKGEVMTLPSIIQAVGK